MVKIMKNANVEMTKPSAQQSIKAALNKNALSAAEHDLILVLKGSCSESDPLINRLDHTSLPTKMKRLLALNTGERSVIVFIEERKFYREHRNVAEDQLGRNFTSFHAQITINLFFIMPFKNVRNWTRYWKPYKMKIKAWRLIYHVINNLS